ncbi:MAG: hypothetical protein NE330_15855 [Lentisphaeraceae bacterium]|nr:hypothetical protein [Lentisphaeraceae bacterium]
MSKFLILFLSLFISARSHALDVQDVYYGFDNQVVNNSFNFITFSVHNNTPKAFDDVISLKHSGISVKTINTKHVFLAPNQRKTVQMYFYIQEHYDKLIIQAGNDSVKTDIPSQSKGANIFISDKPRRLPKHFKSFPQEVFPVSTPLTNSLSRVIFDTSPDWTPAQKATFMSWLKLGGIAIVLEKRTGGFPKFTSLMSPLNGTDKVQQIGAGQIQRLKSIDKIRIPNFRPTNSNSNYSQSTDDSIFSNLQLLVKTDHNWAFIYFLIVVYLLLIGPANYFIGRKTRDWKIPNLFFILTVAGFSILFAIIGKRGYGEETKICSFTFADHIEDDQYNISQWSNIFVTSGNQYVFSHNTKGNLYGSPGNFEMATHLSQSDGKFIADIPLFSSKKMIHSASGTGADIKITNSERTVRNVKLTVDSKTDIEKAWFIIGNTIHIAIKNGNTFTSGTEINIDDNIFYNSDETKVYENIPKMILRDSLNNKNIALSYNNDPTINSQSIHFFALTETPKSLHTLANITDNETGFTLNRFKLNLEEAF